MIVRFDVYGRNRGELETEADKQLERFEPGWRKASIRIEAFAEVQDTLKGVCLWRGEVVADVGHD